MPGTDLDPDPSIQRPSARHRSPMHRSALSLLTAGLAFTAAVGDARAAGKAHVHGNVTIDVAIDGSTLAIAMAAPLDNLLGFERAPRTDAERGAAAAVLARLRAADQAAALFATDAAALCTLTRVEVRAPVLEPAATAGSEAAPADGHADLDAAYEFSCARATALRRLDVGLFDAYPRIRRIDVQVAGPKGQSKVTLRRPARSVELVR